MSTSQRLSMRDMRCAFRIVGEVCELGDDTAAWRYHMTAALCMAVGATKGFSDEEIVAREPTGSAVVGIVLHGFDAADIKNLSAFQAKGGFHISPLFPAIRPIATRPWTKVRRELVPDDRAWYGSAVVNDHQRPADMDDCIHTRQPLSRPGWSHMCNVFRPFNARPFGVRERRFVHLVHEELARLWSRPLPPDPVDGLPPRLRGVARHLRAGDSEKQAALRLGLTRQTVHSYAKELHRHVGVTNRYDLLARLAVPRGGRRPVLSFEVPPTRPDAAGSN